MSRKYLIQKKKPASQEPLGWGKVPDWRASFLKEFQSFFFVKSLHEVAFSSKNLSSLASKGHFYIAKQKVSGRRRVVKSS